MADRRKLQGEIDRCLKKITEGVDIFEDIWQKILAAPNVAMKEKHEADLKKEIKKLQRLRDMIKAWLASSDIKDKKTLLDYKKLIEVQMERFKVIERETKTKAYSKEGLGAAVKVDPKEKEKEDITNWLATSIEELNVQIDQCESEIESVSSKKKKLDKEKQDFVEMNKQHVERHRYHVDQLETIMRLVNNDALDLQQILKIKDDVEYYISSSREPDYEANEYLYDDLHLEEVSATLGAKLGSAGLLHDDNESGISETSETLSQQNSSSPSPSPSLTATTTPIAAAQHSKGEEDGPRTRLRSSASESRQQQQNGPSVGGGGGSHARSGKHGSGGSKSGSNSCSEQSQQQPQQLPQLQRSSSVSSSSSSTAAAAAAAILLTSPLDGVGTLPSVSAAAAAHSQNYAQAAGASHHIQQQHSYSGLPTPVSSDRKSASGGIRTSVGDIDPITVGGNWGSRGSTLPPPSSSAWGEPTLSVVTTAKSSSAHPLLSLAAAARGQLQQQQTANSQSVPAIGAGSGDDMGGVTLNGPATVIPNSASLLMATPSTPGVSVIQNPGPAVGTSRSQSVTPNSGTLGSLKSMTQQVLESVSQPPVPAGTDISSPYPRNPVPMAPTPASLAEYQNLMGKPSVAGTGVSTVRFHPVLGVAPLGPQPLDRVNLLQLAMLESASSRMPLSDDSERVRMYFPRSPAVVPPYYANIPPQISDSLDFFNRLNIETLFFIFYYMEGTKAQYLAAKALKHKSWRFHTKLLMWFQRHEEPKIITEEYEQGSYLYFDFETWVQRQNEAFTFEYKYLEDHELQ